MLIREEIVHRIRRYSRTRIAILVAIALTFVGLLVFDVAAPITPMEQQALVGLILVLGIPAFWLL